MANTIVRVPIGALRKTERGGGSCLSTHGGSGYAPGSYWDGGAIICGVCGARIENPMPTGAHKAPRPGWLGRALFFLFGIGRWQSKYPEWIKA